ncbi:NAD(+) synthase [Archaeoglobus fulgidus]|jgi:NAD+ synthase|uniref:NH(3)-dependent NAD(+) synthetase n=3 Tax=Archaeoglobus fulgidus TaxID=2234 RepID=NADE_ARCFU|nr:NAD(+) synthase [Archaeoglobus fulgidus]O29262.1 RecName: Full=NH(3)-dependent NAD(+) synthetase [Archaeoglobus fulgidus DSM 4304]AAB90242.1 NH(3)-dependent NAD+ synthetase (nadE) [Archaeoglobus fulgidus DSM 4304]AIG97877.1 NAD+ synthetase [Archaeoglobus fulgidus DSM 8774]KUJ92574.1 MAG: putative NH(3)-dependent NAD(+) synthetase [Archaeoglobus fulgidus]KUK05497.1 MAG: putative NH(3)-dependent NAD(+) synthetase [Archaeoglobus fulgidus]
MNFEKVVERICDFIRGVVSSSGSTGVVLGLSGGVDSATVAYLCVRALGSERVFALIMPETGVTPEQDVEDAINVAESLGMEYKLIEINDIVRVFKEKAGEGSKIAEANLKPRIRMVLNYYHANSMNRLVAGTGNKSELMVGYFTKYGDGGVDFLPIGDLYKTEVFQLAAYLGVPRRIIEKKPSARLWPGQTDEEEMGISYAELDEILKLIEKGERRDDEKFRRVVQMVERSRHKREMPPVARVRDLL